MSGDSSHPHVESTLRRVIGFGEHRLDDVGKRFAHRACDADIRAPSSLALHFLDRVLDARGVWERQCGDARFERLVGIERHGRHDERVDGDGSGRRNRSPERRLPGAARPAPQLVDSGGDVIASPKIVAVFFPGDEASTTSSLSTFVSALGATTYWTTTTKEYGIGAATSLAPVMAADKPASTIADADIRSWLAAKLDAGDPAFPAPDEATVYVLFYPPGVVVTQDAGNGQTVKGCTDFGGYHDDLPLGTGVGALDVAYAVIPRCASFNGIDGLDETTAAASHEMIEAATDPHPTTAPAYQHIDTSHLYWTTLFGGEAGDMCAQFPSSYVKLPDFPYTVQRTWSNMAALAGHDPCQPAYPSAPYFNAVPVLPDDVVAHEGPSMVHVKGVNIPVGQTKTIDVDLFSDAATSGPFTVTASDLSKFLGSDPALELSLDRDAGENGQVLHLTIHVLQGFVVEDGDFPSRLDASERRALAGWGSSGAPTETHARPRTIRVHGRAARVFAIGRCRSPSRRRSSRPSTQCRPCRRCPASCRCPARFRLCRFRRA